MPTQPRNFQPNPKPTLPGSLTVAEEVLNIIHLSPRTVRAIRIHFHSNSEHALRDWELIMDKQEHHISDFRVNNRVIKSFPDQFIVNYRPILTLGVGKKERSL